MANNRLREIVRVFSAVGLTGLKERRKGLDEQTVPQKLRAAFEELGPSFVKIGQILSTRSDLLPEPYIKELSKLQDSVLPLPAGQALQAIEAELGQPVGRVFRTVSEEPLASASVAQTHRAVFLSGQEVVIKIQRPHLTEIISEDIAILLRLSKKMPKRFLPSVDLREVLLQLKESLAAEIDFRQEAQAMLDFAEKNQSVNCLAVPQVFTDFTTRHMIVEEYIPGIPINHYEALLKEGYDLEDIGRKLMLSFIKQVFKDGYFHGDPHPGNLLIHNNKIYFIDFGIMGQLQDDMRASLNDVLYSFTTQDVDGMAKAILTVTEADSSLIDKVGFSQDIEQMLTKYANLDLGNLFIADLLTDLLSVSQRNHLKAPPQITVLGKAVLQIEGIFRELAPDVNLMTLAKHYFIENMGQDMLTQVLNRESLLIELFYLLKNGKNIPRKVNELSEKLLSGRLLINYDIHDYSKRMRSLQRLADRFVLTFIFMALLLAASILSFNPPFLLLAKVLFLLAGLVLVSLLFLIISSRKF
ncbi:AarF/ABC1/UbiB kinase family protein [Streptococcus chenjunshii]|uniref:AarF/ABC1/UbiB kinase family protein n=1 Tax=Streptococcus chenjunshii TaxID=2173853 RepID=A0A372KNV0_9STRE|nr:AarF/UbiB family protein [Streptococcus chenjunshii]AXQ78763.1 AarF/ABC1/UbiB kinase family protein [Streptococcus chenjunshii]RFU51644.1 AarF/ABC1/UbiB kinase family protein [Streptococcus chenjunshii]RFU53965.1 AarF/ABC1/UbiB kinase family protein [Streptococcus chenjunshii]